MLSSYTSAILSLNLFTDPRFSIYKRISKPGVESDLFLLMFIRCRGFEGLCARVGDSRMIILCPTFGTLFVFIRESPINSNCTYMAHWIIRKPI